MRKIVTFTRANGFSTNLLYITHHLKVLNLKDLKVKEWSRGTDQNLLEVLKEQTGSRDLKKNLSLLNYTWNQIHC